MEVHWSIEVSWVTENNKIVPRDTQFTNKVDQKHFGGNTISVLYGPGMDVYGSIDVSGCTGNNKIVTRNT